MTKETEKALKILYCEYKKRRKSGNSKSTAMEFASDSIPRINAFHDWMHEDIQYALRELRASGYVRIFLYGDAQLTENALEFMEDKPKEFFSSLSGFFDLVGLFV